MDLETKRFPIRVSQGISPAALGSENSSDPSFPILAIAVIGIIATAFLLVSYYVFVIKCCLNWHRIDLLSSRFSLSRRRRNQDDLLLLSSPAMEARGLDEAAIRSIPIFNFKNRGNDKSRDGEGSFCECAVCLNEFQEDEKLRIIPQCSHVFHIDCIDVWLQNNANCPLCRTSVSGGSHLALFDPCRIAAPSPSPQEPASYLDSNAIIRNEEDYVVIELGESSSSSTSLSSIQPGPAAISPRKPDPGKQRKKKFIQTSMGDEVIDTRGVDEQFSSIQPIRRSFSMDSAADQKLFLAVQGILQQRSEFQDLGLSPNGSCSSRARRTFFSFGHGRASRSAVQPLCLEP